MMESHVLWYIVLDDSASHTSVDIHSAHSINDLKKAINSQRKDIPVSNMILWKVTNRIMISLPHRKRADLIDEINRIQIPDSDSDEARTGSGELQFLDSVLPVSYYWKERPEPLLLHLIVQVPRSPECIPLGLSWDNTTSYDVLEIDALRPHIQKTLDIIRPRIEAFLQNPELPEWVPPSTDSDVGQFFRNLRIPTYQDGSPSLLFHHLHYPDDDQAVNGIFGKRQEPFHCDTFGSGETRRILEGLTNNWGLYFVAARDENNVGINDLEHALKDIGCDMDWTDDLRPFKEQERTKKNRNNICISRWTIRKVFAARLVVFTLFLRLAEARDGSLLPEHRRLWLLFQLHNPLPGSKTPHPFITMNECLDRATEHALRTLIYDFDNTHRQYFPESKFIIALDEAQVASRMYRYSFLTSRDPRKFRSILSEIVKVLSDFQVVVSGTGNLSWKDVDDNTNTSVGKPPSRFQRFSELGMFDDSLKVEATLRKYIPPSVLESDFGTSLQLQIQEHLPCRYRFLISLLELLLRNGLENPHTLLNEYLALCPSSDMPHATRGSCESPL